MIEPIVTLDPRIVELPLDAPLLLVTGEPGSGKSDVLARRYAAVTKRYALAPAQTIVAAAGTDTAAALLERATAYLEPPRRAELDAAPFTGITLDVLAFAIVRDGALTGGLAPDLERLEPHETEEIFERAAAPLFSAEWADYLGVEIDPEVSGLRAPDRFAATVLRLIVKLRDAGIGPDEFLSRAQRGAATFYGKLPNLADPALLMATRDEHRASLMVGAAELERQRKREIDAAKIVAKLYRSYLEELVRHGCLAAGDALAEAVRMLGEQPALAAAYRERLRFAIVDDVQDLRASELRLLEALFGETLVGVTFAGALDAAIRTFAGARPEHTFKRAATTIVLPSAPRNPAIAAAAKAILGIADRAAISGGAVSVVRAADRAAEATAIADRIAQLVKAGTPPHRIALVHRGARTLAPFEEALLAQDVPVTLHGDIDLLARADVQDGLAMLWSAVDPYRHDWLLRALQSPLVALSDASLAILCGEPADPQVLLFPLPPDDPDTDRRWDRRRDLRLASNVLQATRDAELGPVARERLVAFRARRARWAAYARDAGALAAEAILADSGLRDPRPAEGAARAARRNALLAHLLQMIDRYAERFRGAPLDDALAMLDRVAAAERGPLVSDPSPAGVFVGAIDCIGARRFDDVFAVDVRAGAFPPYYVPDAFLFSAQWGMIPKEAPGDGSAARTAKFTWYHHHAKLRDAFAKEHRRLLAFAFGRADRSVTVSASGKPTRGIGAPELAVELAKYLPSDAPRA